MQTTGVAIAASAFITFMVGGLIGCEGTPSTGQPSGARSKADTGGFFCGGQPLVACPNGQVFCPPNSICASDSQSCSCSTGFLLQNCSGKVCDNASCFTGTQYTCAPSASVCITNTNLCTSNLDCCSGSCTFSDSGFAGRNFYCSCAPNGSVVANWSGCCSGNVGPDGACACVPDGQTPSPAWESSLCCSGFITGTTSNSHGVCGPLPACRGTGELCSDFNDGNCCSKACLNGFCQ